MTLADYEPIVGKSTIDELRLLGDRLSGKVVENINSTFIGGGVAEILRRMVPLMRDLGVDARWNIIKGSGPFFDVTKKFHNALHGAAVSISNADTDLFLEVGRKNAAELNMSGDIMFIHDPQPIVLVERRKEIGEKWLWRCHVDVSQPSEALWGFLAPYIHQYDSAIFSAPAFSRPLPIRQFLVSPSIDPLSEKNKELSRETIEAVLQKYGVPDDKPIISQISRFDYLKDPVGVIKAFELVRKGIDCRLILAGGTASDDPEGNLVLAEVRERAGDNKDIHILAIPPDSDVDINALQRASDVVVQKSIREGFGLTVTEALWKGRPVVASAVGGITLQVKNRLTGLLSHGIEGTAHGIRQLLANPEYAKWLGENGREHVRHDFLITRHIRDYLMAFLVSGQSEDTVSF